MDINCTYACMYQNEGKCSLMCVDWPTSRNMKSIPVFKNFTENETYDCPYFFSEKSETIK